MTTKFNPTSEFWQTLNKGAQLLHQGRPGEAIAVLQPLYQQDPTQVDVTINLGGAYILQRKWNRAVAVLSKAIEAHPENAMLWANLAAAHLGNLETAGPRHQERAIAAYERVLALDPAAPNVHYHLGLIHKERGDLQRAADAFQNALALDPQDRDARFWLERIHRLQAQQAQPDQDAPSASEVARDQGNEASV